MVGNTVVEYIRGVADSYQTIDSWRGGRACLDRAYLFRSAAT
jgi:hypothetical protein